MTAARQYSLDEAQALLPAARTRVGELAEVVGQLRTLFERRGSGPAPVQSAEAVAMLQETLDALLVWFDHRDIRIASLEPTLLDFPARAILDGEPLDVLLCWRDDEETIAYYHRLDAGYRGRAPVALLERV